MAVKNIFRIWLISDWLRMPRANNDVFEERTGLEFPSHFELPFIAKIYDNFIQFWRVLQVFSHHLNWISSFAKKLLIPERLFITLIRTWWVVKPCEKWHVLYFIYSYLVIIYGCKILRSGHFVINLNLLNILIWELGI